MSDVEPPSTANRLAQTRTDLASDRTVMAADRTLMAWIRTALSMIAFGFTIYKFLSGFKGSSTIHLENPDGPRRLGIMLTVLGTGSLVAGVIQYIQVMRQTGTVLRFRVALYVSWAVVALGLTILVGVAFHRGPF